MVLQTVWQHYGIGQKKYNFSLSLCATLQTTQKLSLGVQVYVGIIPVYYPWAHMSREKADSWFCFYPCTSQHS